MALKKLKPSVRVYGVAWEGTPDFCRNFNRIKKGKECPCRQDISQVSKSGLTDGIAVKKSNLEMVSLCSQNVDGIACVNETEISKCIANIYQMEHTVLEGSGVASLAGLLKYHDIWELGENCCVVLSGANIDRQVLSKALLDSKK